MQNRHVKAIQQCIRENKLMRIERKEISSEVYAGFPVWLNNEFLLLTNVYDFHDEGYLLLRCSDITNVSFSEESFYESICLNEKLQKRGFDCPVIPSDTMEGILRQLEQYPRYITLHCEKEIDECRFFLGKIKKIEESNIKFSSIDGDGQWYPDVDVIPYKRITMIAWDDYYANMYYKYRG